MTRRCYRGASFPPRVAPQTFPRLVCSGVSGAARRESIPWKWTATPTPSLRLGPFHPRVRTPRSLGRWRAPSRTELAKLCIYRENTKSRQTKPTEFKHAERFRAAGNRERSLPQPGRAPRQRRSNGLASPWLFSPSGSPLCLAATADPVLFSIKTKEQMQAAKLFVFFLFSNSFRVPNQAFDLGRTDPRRACGDNNAL